MSRKTVEQIAFPVWPHLEQKHFERRDFSLVSFAGCKLKGAVFSDCTFNKLILIGAELGENTGLPAFDQEEPFRVIRNATELEAALPSFTASEVKELYNTLLVAYKDMQGTVDSLQVFSESMPDTLPEDNPGLRQTEIAEALRVLAKEMSLKTPPHSKSSPTPSR